MNFWLKIISVIFIVLPFQSCFGPFNPDDREMGIVSDDTTETQTPETMVAWWKCDDSLDFVNSTDYTSIKAEIQSGVSFDTGVDGIGLSLLFNTDTYVNVYNDSLLNFKLTDFTISLWCKPAQANDPSILISKGTVDSLNSFTVAISGSTPNVIIGATSHLIDDTLQLDTWNHIVFTRESGGVSLFLNAKRYSIGAESPYLYNTKPLRIGATSNNSDYYRGNIDEIKIERKAWSETEIESEYSRFK